MKRLSICFLCLSLMVSSLFSQKPVNEGSGISYSDKGFVIVSPVEGICPLNGIDLHNRKFITLCKKRQLYAVPNAPPE